MSLSHEQYVDSMEDMIASQGWTLLVEDAKQSIHQIQCDALECASWEEVLINRGRALQLNELVHQKDMIANLRQELTSSKELGDATVSL